MLDEYPDFLIRQKARIFANKAILKKLDKAED